ncbi:MAG: Uma2 family endonuclease [Anaerolineae bacterium]
MIVVPHLTDEQFEEFCQRNQDVRVERTSHGDLIIMPPTGGATGNRSAALITMLTVWAWQDGSGETFDSSTGFDLPNGATRSPDAAWVSKERLASLFPAARGRFLPLCPEFVAELRSPSDDLAELQDKMQEYIENGAQLAWLIDPAYRRVYVYRPDLPVEAMREPSAVSGEPVLPGFVLDLARLWRSLD